MMDDKENNRCLKNFSTKSHVQKPDKVEFKNIRLRCTATCDMDENKMPLQCNIEQKSGSNTFRITLNKEVKFSEGVGIGGKHF